MSKLARRLDVIEDAVRRVQLEEEAARLGASIGAPPMELIERAERMTVAIMERWRAGERLEDIAASLATDVDMDLAEVREHVLGIVSRWPR